MKKLATAWFGTMLIIVSTISKISGSIVTRIVSPQNIPEQVKA